MNIHQLAIFWRDQQARAFTSLHFSVGENETPKSRAAKIVRLFQQFTILQIYGAVLDQMPIDIEIIKAAPPSAMDSRLEFNLFPDAPIAPRYGVVPIGFTILAPTEDIATIAKEKMHHSGWGHFDQVLLPFLLTLMGGNKTTARPLKTINSARSNHWTFRILMPYY